MSKLDGLKSLIDNINRNRFGKLNKRFYLVKVEYGMVKFKSNCRILFKNLKKSLSLEQK